MPTKHRCMDLGTLLWGVQLIRALQEQMPNALIANQLEGQRSFRLDQRRPKNVKFEKHIISTVRIVGQSLNVVFCIQSQVTPF